MVFKSSSGKTLLVGGASEEWTAFRDTWEWDGEEWVQVADTGPAHPNAGISFDSGRDVVVLYGGMWDWASTETWEWDGEYWGQAEDTGPKAESFKMVYDAARQVTVLDGGSVVSGGVGTWAWDGKTWTQLADTGPSLRVASAMAFDQSRERVVVFSGWVANQPSSATLSDTWEWDGTAWKQRGDTGPAPRSGHAMAGIGEAVILFGGGAAHDPNFAALQDTWEWDGKRWRQRQDMGPQPRWSHSMAWDAARNRVVLFGGMSQDLAVLADTWEAFETP